MVDAVDNSARLKKVEADLKDVLGLVSDRTGLSTNHTNVEHIRDALFCEVSCPFVAEPVTI